GPERPIIRRLGPDVAYARLPTMTPANYAHVAQDRPSWPQPTGREKALVVDLRGNGGNAANLGFDVLRDWVPRSMLPSAEPIAMEVTTSCLTAPLTWGRDRPLVAAGPPSPRSSLGWLQRELDALAAPSPDGCPRGTRVLPAREPTYRRHHLQADA